MPYSIGFVTASTYIFSASFPTSDRRSVEVEVESTDAKERRGTLHGNPSSSQQPAAGGGDAGALPVITLHPKITRYVPNQKGKACRSLVVLGTLLPYIGCVSFILLELLLLLCMLLCFIVSSETSTIAMSRLLLLLLTYFCCF
jgi:hypothetical protein